MVEGAVTTSPWVAPRRRAKELRERHAFAAEVLGVYLALLDVWEESWENARADLDASADIAAWSAEHVLPRVVAATAATGPAPLVDELLDLGSAEPAVRVQLLRDWLQGEQLAPALEYLARATLRGPLAATDAAAITDDRESGSAPRSARHCPQCGGLPQLSLRSNTKDNLATGIRKLQCSRCSHTWPFASAACASCGELEGGRLTFYSEARPGMQVARGDNGDATFPHVRIAACSSCERYLIDVDLNRDPLAVPEVDELAALPLDLYAAEHGLTKITPNMMGF